MAPAASILAAAAASSKRPADSDSSSSALPPPQQGGGDVEHEHQAARSSSKSPQLECPRCRSTNTKFCYYNNYSTAQPRHFCRACRRYWTHGGTLRDVPVGGATRRANKRRRAEEPAPSSSPPPPQTTVPVDLLDDACPPGLAAAFPFLSDGSYLPQLDRLGGFFAPFSSWHSSDVVQDFYDGIAPPPWDNGTVAASSPLGDVAGLDFTTWPPPPAN